MSLLSRRETFTLSTNTYIEQQRNHFTELGHAWILGQKYPAYCLQIIWGNE